MNELPKPELFLNWSEKTLQDLLLASLDRESRLIKTAKECWQAAVREEAIALVAEYFLKYRAEIEERLESLEVRKIA